MVLTRYLLYFAGIALLTFALTQIEIASPGSLKLQVFTHADDLLGTSEYSPIEWMQPGILLICGLLYAWVAQRCPQQAPVAAIFGALATMFFVRELDFFLDRLVADNFWQAPVAVIMAITGVYGWRHRRRLRFALSRAWPSPGLTLLYAGAVVHFAFVPFVGHEPLWQAVLGDDYRRIIKLALEEFVELAGYFLWLIGTIEYVFQARALAAREPAEDRRRSGRRRGRGKY